MRECNQIYSKHYHEHRARILVERFCSEDVQFKEKIPDPPDFVSEDSSVALEVTRAITSFDAQAEVVIGSTLGRDSNGLHKSDKRFLEENCIVSIDDESSRIWGIAPGGLANSDRCVGIATEAMERKLDKLNTLRDNGEFLYGDFNAYWLSILMDHYFDDDEFIDRIYENISKLSLRYSRRYEKVFLIYSEKFVICSREGWAVKAIEQEALSSAIRLAKLETTV